MTVTTKSPPATSELASTLANLQSQQPIVPARQRRGAPDQVAPEAALPEITVGFTNLQSWEFTQRVARGLSMSTMVPEPYRAFVPEGRFGAARDRLKENPSGLPNCIVALNMAQRLRADPLMVMQNLHIIEGRPSWGAQFVIAQVNASPRFKGSLKFRVQKGDNQTVSYLSKEFDGRELIEVTKTVTVRAMSCVAYATDSLGEVLEGPEVTMEMAVIEGWYGKKGSKWQTMPDLMIRYRAAAFFARLHAPELLMGLHTEDELQQIIDAEMDAQGDWSVRTTEIEPDIADIQGEAEQTSADPAAAEDAAGDEDWTEMEAETKPSGSAAQEAEPGPQAEQDPPRETDPPRGRVVRQPAQTSFADAFGSAE